MTMLFIAVATGVLIGTVFLWLSGYYTGQAMTGDQSQAAPSPDPMLTQQILTEKKRIQTLQAELEELKAAPASVEAPPVSDELSAKESEIAALSSQVAKAQGERDKALFERDNIKEELEHAQKNLAGAKKMEKPTSLPKPEKRDTNPISESEALDELQAEIDMEKVSHQLTKDEYASVRGELDKVKKELDQLKKLAAAKVGGGSNDGPAQGGSRFKTMAIGMRSPVAGGSDQNILRAALEKVQTEKDRVESELERARKEIQFLKMRG